MTEALVTSICCNPETSPWLRSAIETAFKRNPLDALYDADLLACLLRCQFDQNVLQQVLTSEFAPGQRVADIKHV